MSETSLPVYLKAEWCVGVLSGVDVL